MSAQGYAWACNWLTWYDGVDRYGKAVPEEIKNLVMECWEPQPDNRPSFEQIAKRLQTLFDAMPADKKKKCGVM